MTLNGCAPWVVIGVLAVQCRACGFILATVQQTGQDQGWRINSAPGWRFTSSGLYERAASKMTHRDGSVRIDKEPDGSSRTRVLMLCQCGEDAELDVSPSTIDRLLAERAKVQA